MDKGGRMWKRNKHTVKPDISIYGKIKEIYIGKDILRLLGAPKFICLKINKGMDSFIISPCEGKEFMSFKVPEDIMSNPNKKMRVFSRSFVSGILIMNGMSDEATYKITGTYLEKNNAVVFKMSDAKVYGKEVTAKFIHVLF